MNDRLITLAKQSGLKKDHGTDREYIGDFDWREFGELIVRECMILCEKQEYDYWRSAEDQDFTPVNCADAIKDHFGVKE